MKKACLKVLVIYTLLTLISTLLMRDFSFNHTILFLVDAIIFVFGEQLLQEKRQYYKALAVTGFIIGSPLIIRAITPTLIRIWEVITYFSFTFALTNIIIIIIFLLPKQILKFSLGLPIILVTFFPIAICWGYYFSEYSWMNVEAVMAIMQSNPAESLAYIQDHTGIGGYIAALLYPILAFLSTQQIAQLKPNTHTHTYYALIALFAILNVILLVRTTHINFLFDIYTETMEYQKNYDQFEKERENRKTHLFNSLNLERYGEPGIYVLVIGESQNKTHLSAYGYGSQTSPNLDMLKNSSQAIFFQNAYSNHVQTVPALTYALTAKNQYNDYALEDAVSLLEVAEAAGFETVWISNQVKLGTWGTPTAVIADEADQQIWLNEHTTDTLSASYYDEEVVNRLDTIDKFDKMLIILHFMGSHDPYKDRYPKNFEKFAADNQNVSEYDNSTYYNDYVMKQLIDKLNDMPEFKAMIYFSDHSEAINYGHGHNPSTFIFDMSYIPFYVYFSPDYINSKPAIVTQLRQAKSYYFTNDLIFNTVLGIMDIRESNLYEPNNDLTNVSYDNNPNRFLTLHGQIHINEDIK